MTTLSLAGIDVGPDGALVFRFLEGSRALTWHFRASSFPEFLALLLGGRLGAGNEVHFDAATVVLEEPKGGRRGSVGIAIGKKATIVAPLPAGPAEKPQSAAGRRTPSRAQGRTR